MSEPIRNFIVDHENIFYSFSLMSELEKYVQENQIKSFRLIVAETIYVDLTVHKQRIILTKIVNR